MVSTQVKARVLALWRDPAVGLTGLHRFRRKLVAHGIDLPLSELRDILRAEPAHVLFAYNPRGRIWNTIVETGVGHGMQMDLMDMSKIATRNKNFYWILCIIDVYSRYAWAFPVKRKTQQCVYDCLKSWLQSLSQPPKRITSDAGKEFTNARVRQLLRHYQVIPYVNQAGDKTTTGIVERFNRTLRDLMGRNFTRLQKLHWIEDLPRLVQNYNRSVHSTLGHTPEDVWLGRQKPKPRHISRERFPFQDGDCVRLLLPRGIFDKRAGSQRWSTKLYYVVRREGFKYVVRNSQNIVLKTRYRPCHLQAVAQEEEKERTGLTSVSAAPRPQVSRPALREQWRQAANQRRRQRILRQLDAPPPRKTRRGLRPSTLRRHLRPRSTKKKMNLSSDGVEKK